MSDEPFPEHLGQISERVKDLQPPIVQAMSEVGTQPVAAYASFRELDQTISDLERQHSQWSSGYFLFRLSSGPGGETIQQYHLLSDKITRNLAKLHLWVLMGAGQAADSLGRLDEAQQWAAAGAERCGTQPDLVMERAQFLFQLATVSYRKNEFAAAGDAAMRAHDAALSGGLWVNAAQALFIAALSALMLDDRQSLTRCCTDAARLTAAHGEDPQMRRLRGTLLGFQFSAQGALDKTGSTEAERKQLAESTLRSVMEQMKQQAQ